MQWQSHPKLWSLLPSRTSAAHNGQGGGEGIRSPGPDYQSLPLVGTAWGRPGGKGEGAPSFHKTHGGMTPFEAPAPVQFRTVGTAAAVKSGETAPQAETHPRKNGQRAEQQRAATGAMPGQRRGKESSQGVCQQFLCRASPVGRGAQRRAVQSGGTQWRRSNTCARGRGRALHTTPAARQGQAPGNLAAAPAAVALRCTQPQTMIHMRSGGQRGAALLRQAPHRTPPPTGTLGTQGRVRAAGLRTPGGGGGGSAKRPKRHRQAPASRGLAFKRGRGHPDPPPPPAKRARVELHDAAKHGCARTEVT